MRVASTKAHPEGKGRSQQKSYTLGSVGASGRKLPERVESVSVQAYATDGVDKSTSSRVFLEFSLDDDPAQIDLLIKCLSDLRDHQRARALAAGLDVAASVDDPCGARGAVEIHDSRIVPP